MTEICKGYGLERSYRHDWRLWKRELFYLSEESSFGVWPVGGHDEIWYCTRCRMFEERRVEYAKEEEG